VSVAVELPAIASGTTELPTRRALRVEPASALC